MPNNLQKFKFTIDTVRKYQLAAQDVDHLFAKIQPKYRAAKLTKKQQAKNTLLSISRYTFDNIGTLPWKPTAEIGHNADGIQRVRDAKEALKIVFNTIPEGKRGEHQRKYANGIDLLNRFQDHLEYAIRLEE